MIPLMIKKLEEDKKTFLFVIATVISLVTVSFASATTLEVCPSGCIYSTIQAAIDAASPGDTIQVNVGTYNENLIINKYLTLLGPNAGINPNTQTRNPEAIISKETVPGGQNLGIVNIVNSTASNVTFDGFEVRTESSPNASIRGIEINGADYVTVENTIVHHMGEALIYPNYANFLTVENCTLYDNNGIEAIKVSSELSGTHTCNDVTIKNNNIYNTGRGIWVYYGSRWTIENNTIHDLGDFGINVDNGGNHTVRNNIIYRVGYAGIKAEKTSTIIHNTIVEVSGPDTSGYYGSGIAVKAAFTGGIIKDNIIASNTKGIYYREATSGVTIDYNDVWNNTYGDNVWNNSYGNYVGFTAGPGPHDISTDPLFVNSTDPDPWTGFDLMCNPLSPCRAVASDETSMGAVQSECAEDTTAPDLIIISPADFFNETATGTVTFNYTAVDSNNYTTVNGDLDTCELWGNWSGGWHLNESFVSPPEDATNGSSNITLEDGLYVWTVYCNDTANNYNNTVENRTLTVDINAPSLTVVSPLNNTADIDGWVYFNYTAVDAFVGLDSCWLTINGEINMSNVSSEVPENFTVSLIEGRYAWNVSCNDSLNNVANSDTYDLSIVLATEFSGDTTDISQVNVTNIINLVIEVPSYGKINFTDDVDLSNGGDLNTYLNISFNSINVNTSVLPELNKSAMLYLYNLTFSNPRILREGLVCPSDVCVNILYSGGVLEFSTMSFSVYSTEETPTVTAEAVAGGTSSTPQGGYAPVNVSEGVVRVMSIKDAFVVSLGELGGGSTGGEESYQIVLNKLTSDSVTLLIYPGHLEVVLRVGESKKVDVDGDGILDIFIELRGIDVPHQKAEVYFEDITPMKEAAPPAEEAEEVAEEKPLVPTGEEPAAPKEVPSRAWLWILVIVILVVMVLGYFVLRKRVYDVVSFEGKESSAKGKRKSSVKGKKK